MIRKKKGVAVFVDGRRARVLEAEVQGQVLAAGRCAAGSLPAAEGEATPEKMGKLVRTLLDRAGIRTDRALAVLPTGAVILRRFLLPGGSTAEVEQMIHFQALKSLPVGEGAVKMGYFLQDAPKGQVDVTAVGVLHEVVTTLERTFATAGLRLEGLTLASIGAYNAYLGSFGAPADGQDVALVEVGESAADITLVHGDSLAYSRSSPSGEAGLAEKGDSEETVAKVLREGLAAAGAEPWAARLAGEIRLSVRNYIAQNKGRKVSRVWLTGRMAGAKGLGEKLSGDLQMEVIAPEGLPENLTWEASGEKARDYIPLAGALWGDLDRTGIRFDLLADYFTQLGKKKSRRTPYLAVAAAICVLAALILIPDHFVSQREGENKALKREVDRLEKEEKARVESLEKKAEELRSWTRERVLWIDVLLEITKAKPLPPSGRDWGVYLTNVRFREKEPIRLNGRARTEADAMAYARNLQQSSMFRSADMKSFQKSSRKGEYALSFEFEARLEEGEKE
jgi:Tfp pilus assembly PilM family ATPase/Tfp pilus assembly protein PilN